MLFGLVATTSAALVDQFGSGSLVAASAVSGIVDVDVATLTALRMVKQAMPMEIVGQAVLAAVAVNAASRVVMAASAGPFGYWVPLAVITALAAGSAFLVYALLPAFADV